MTSEQRDAYAFRAYAVGASLPVFNGGPGYAASSFVILGLTGYEDPATAEIFASRKATRRMRAAVLMSMVGVVECPSLPNGAEVTCFMQDEELRNSYHLGFLHPQTDTPMEKDEGEIVRLLKAIADKRLKFAPVFVRPTRDGERDHPILRDLKKRVRLEVRRRDTAPDPEGVALREAYEAHLATRPAHNTPRRFPEVAGGYRYLPDRISRKPPPPISQGAHDIPDTSPQGQPDAK